MAYYRGNFEKERAARRGWLLGYFMREASDDARATDQMEVKYWKFGRREATQHVAKYLRTGFECTLILSGTIVGTIDGKPVTLEAGEYVAIPPGVVSNFPTEILEDAVGLTIKAPSIEGDTVKLPS